MLLQLPGALGTIRPQKELRMEWLLALFTILGGLAAIDQLFLEGALRGRLRALYTSWLRKGKGSSEATKPSGPRLSPQKLNDREVITALHQAAARGLLGEVEASFLGEAVEGLGPLEFEIIELFDNPSNWSEQRNVQLPSRGSVSRSQLLETAIPSLKGMNMLYDQYVERLYAKRLLLLSSDSLHQVVVFGDELLKPMTTPMGHKLAHLMRDLFREPSRV